MDWQSLLPKTQGIVPLDRDVARHILRCGDGDAALLYLSLCEQGPASESELCRRLGFSPQQYQRATHTLLGIALPISHAPSPDAPAGAEGKSARYTVGEMRLSRQEDPVFAAVCEAGERAFDRATLTEGQLRLLYHAYEGLRLPGDVIIDLLSYLKSRGEVTRRAVEQELTIWADRGICTAAAADEYLRESERLRPVCAAMVSALRREESSLLPRERATIESWARMGFDQEAVELALQRAQRAGKPFSWRYLTGILKDWQQKGLFSAQAIRQAEPEDGPGNARRQTPAERAYLTQRQPEGQLTDWEKQWLQQVEQYKKQRRQS